MIAIDVTVTVKNLTTENLVLDHNRVPLLKPYYQNIRNFFNECVNQNLLLNVTTALTTDEDAENGRDVCRYFAISTENAEQFQNKFLDMTTEFSMKKMWENLGYDVSISQQEIDFDTVEVPFDLVGDNGDLWEFGMQAGMPVTFVDD